MTVQNFAHIGVCVSDPDRSMSFYCDLLGFEPLSKLVRGRRGLVLGLDPQGLGGDERLLDGPGAALVEEDLLGQLVDTVREATVVILELFEPVAHDSAILTDAG